MNELPNETIEPIALTGDEQPQRPNLFRRFRTPLIVVAVAAAVGGPGWWALNRTPSAEKVVEVESVATNAEPKAPSFGEVYMIRDLIVNPADGRRIFMVSIGVEHTNPEQTAMIEKREPLLRDNLNTFFASQPSEVLTNIKYRQALRTRVQKIMEYQLGEGVVTRVFFEKWVFQ